MNQNDRVIDEELLLLLRYVLRVGRLSEAKLDGLLSQVDLSATRLLTLRQLEEADEPLSLSQLASCLAFVKSNATQLIDNLEADELVRRQPAPNDRRCTQLEVTSKGKERYGAALEVIQPLLEKLNDAYTPDERAQLLTLLKRLGETLA